MTTEKNIDAVATLREALTTVANWTLPETGKTWDDGTPTSYQAEYGSNGARDYMRAVASAALAATDRASTVAKDTAESAGYIPAHWADKARQIVAGHGMKEDEQRRQAVMLLDVMLRATPKPEASAATQQAGEPVAVVCGADFGAGLQSVPMPMWLSNTLPPIGTKLYLAAPISEDTGKPNAEKAGGLSTLKPFAYCVIDGYDREYNTIDEFSGGRSNGTELYTAAQVQAILDERRSAKSVRLEIGVNATEQGGALVIMQPHADGSRTVIYSGQYPIGDHTSVAHTVGDRPTTSGATPVARTPASVGSMANDAHFAHLMGAYLDARLRKSGSTDVSKEFENLCAYIDARTSQMQAAPRNAGDTPTVGAVAWAAIAPTGFIRYWSYERKQVEEFASVHRLNVSPIIGVPKSDAPDTRDALTDAAKAWWEGNRPFGWTEQEHIERPDVNCTGYENDLARVIVAILAKSKGRAS